MRCRRKKRSTGVRDDEKEETEGRGAWHTKL